jgi:hypothetical protein
VGIPYPVIGCSSWQACIWCTTKSLGLNILINSERCTDDASYGISLNRVQCIRAQTSTHSVTQHRCLQARIPKLSTGRELELVYCFNILEYKTISFPSSAVGRRCSSCGAAVRTQKCVNYFKLARPGRVKGGPLV